MFPRHTVPLKTYDPFFKMNFWCTHTLKQTYRAFCIYLTVFIGKLFKDGHSGFDNLSGYFSWEKTLYVPEDIDLLYAFN